MKFTVLLEGQPFTTIDDPAQLAGVIEIGEAPADAYSLVPDELRAAALASMLSAVDEYRRKLTSLEAGLAEASPERVAVWRTKARIAGAVFDGLSGVVSVSDLLAGAVDFTGTGVADAIAAIPDAARGFLEREATAKGIPLIALLAAIKAKADAFDALGLMIDAMEAEAKAGLLAITDEAVLSGGIDAFMATLSATAESDFADAVASLAA